MEAASENRHRERADKFKRLYKESRQEHEELQRRLQELTEENRTLHANLLSTLGEQLQPEQADKAADQETYDATVVSFPKSGRTWLSYLYYNYVLQFLPPEEREQPGETFTYRPEERPEFQRAIAIAKLLQRFPRLRFTHGSPGRGKVAYQQLKVSGTEFSDGPIILLVRDPRDVVISYYYHVSNPDKGYDLPAGYGISDFIRSDLFGIRYIIEHMNQWAAERAKASGPFTILFYEDLAAQVEQQFRDFLFFAGADPVSSRMISVAVEESRFDTLKARELQHRERSGASTDHNMMRMRRGRIGGYRDELPDDDIRYLDGQIASHLDPAFARYIERDAT